MSLKGNEQMKKYGYSNKLKNAVRKIAVISAVTLIACGNTFLQGKASEKTAGQAAASADNGGSYFEKYGALKNETRFSGERVLSAADCTGRQAASDSENGIKLSAGESWCEWQTEFSEDTVAAMEIKYLPDENADGSIMIGIAVDGEFQFDEIKKYELSLVWKTGFDSNTRAFEKDSSGNEIRPIPKKVSSVTVKSIEDPQGMYDEPYLFRFSKGRHTVRIYSYGADFTVSALTLCNRSYKPYSEYLAENSSAAAVNEATYLEAELYESTNSSSIYPSSDSNDPATVPNDPKHTYMNIIGGSNWSQQGESVSWRVNVPKDGMYKLVFRARQSANAGMISYRKLYINGEIPFKEAEKIPFKYSQQWKMFVLGGDEPYLLHLKPGDILTLCCTSGDYAEIIREVKASLSSLNEIYMDVISVTSASPDVYQDYKLETRLPDMPTALLEAADELDNTYKQISKLLSGSGSLASSIKSVSESVRKFGEKPYTITENLSVFKSSLETLGTLISTLSQQPLELDYMIFTGADGEVPKANKGFWSSFTFGFQKFICSFSDDYSSVGGSKKENAINVWVSTGRDQAQIIDRLITSDFSNKTGIGVNLNLVDTGTTLIRATLAGKGPDAALMIPSGTPVELAARGALSELDDYITDETYKSFHSSAWTPFRYNGHVYAVPETQIYQVMFYRTDVFEKLGITVPETWDDFYNVMEIIQTNNLAVGLPEIDSENMGVSASLGVFSALLMQYGCTDYYNKELSETNFNTETAFNAFTDWCRLYTDYGLDRDINIFNRFRTGEVPLAIRNFSDYAQIKQAAPEIRGLWSIAPIPGTRQADGTLSRAETSVVTGCIMLKAAEKHGVEKQTAEFLNWWVSSDIQTRYATELEVTLGIAGRYYSANLEAIKNTAWSADEYAVLSEQLKYIINQPTVPGNYAVGRDLTSALREVIDGTNRPRRALMLYNIDINEEIMRKRIEFGLEK